MVHLLWQDDLNPVTGSPGTALIPCDSNNSHKNKKYNNPSNNNDNLYLVSTCSSYVHLRIVQTCSTQVHFRQ
jgi:hypothetical protein